MIRNLVATRPAALSALVAPVIVVLCLIAATPSATAAEGPAAAGPSEQNLAIGRIYADPLLEDGASLDEVLALATPTVAITMSKTTYSSGDTIEATEFSLKNPGTDAISVELKVWLEIPGAAPIPIIRVGGDGTLSFPASFNQSLAPFTLFKNDGSTALGTYFLSARLLNPTTGLLYSEDLNTFVLK